MSRKKTLLMVLLILALLLSVVLGVSWSLRHYVVVDMEFYPKDARQLDLRDQEISIRHYERILRRLPDCEILWNVPFQDTRHSWDIRELTVTSLDREDLRAVAYFPRLERVNAENCGDYETLLELSARYPELAVEYSVSLGEAVYDSEAEQVTLAGAAAEEISRLDYLPNLKRVLCGGGEPEALAVLKAYCRERQLEFLILLGEEPIALDATAVTADGVTEAQLDLLQLLPELEQLHLRQPAASAQRLTELRQLRPDMALTWEQQVCGQVFSSDAVEIDLSGAVISDLETLDRELSYFPDAAVVFLGECGLDNDLLAAHREQARDRYKLVWTVSCGSKLKTRTDARTFMPVREQVYYFNDEEAYNLRYCEDMVCIDVGHMSIHNIDFVEYMPNLEYLILAHTQLQYIDPVSTCKKLKFLELDWSPLRDLTPLLGCTALEDLNLGNTYADFAPLEEMTWLKNLWMIGCSSGARYRMTEALPDTRVMVTGSATVANGWRDLDNYYAMRDLLGMHYMSW